MKNWTVNLLFAVGAIALGVAMADPGPIGSICGQTDDRVPVVDYRNARMGGCSAFMIGDGVFVSAGHCFVGPQDLFVEFGVPLSGPEGDPTPAIPDHTWEVDKDTAIIRFGDGADFAVFHVLPNSSARMPWEVFGKGYDIGQIPEETEAQQVAVIGHGRSSRWWGDPLSQTLRIAYGPLRWVDLNHAYYYVDTEVASSGSAVLNARDEAIAVHTDGGCATEHQTNRGWRLDEPRIAEAIRRMR